MTKTDKYNGLPSVKLTQQDFVSTFPWGLRSDEVRIKQQQTENILLNAESTVAMATMLGIECPALNGFGERLDNAWQILLNSQNHDIHVCTQEEAGIAWCDEAAPLASAIRDEAAALIAEKMRSDVVINTLSFPRRDDGRTVPQFGIAGATKLVSDSCASEWVGWFDTGAFAVKINSNGTLSIKCNGGEAVIGNLSVVIGGVRYDSADTCPCLCDAVISNNTASVKITGKLGANGEIAYEHKITIADDGIDYVTTFDYGNGVNFGPDIADFEAEPRRTHYFQHEKKLCINFMINDKDAEFLYNSPFLTWPADKNAVSVESIGWSALQGKHMGLAHMNIGQGGYAKNGGSASHVLCFSPHDYIYGKSEKIQSRGIHTHSFRFLPYNGDWRNAGLPEICDKYNRQLVYGQYKGSLFDNAFNGSLIKILSGSTKATALFSRDKSIYLRIAEWAGCEDTVELKFGDGSALFTEVTHGLKEIGSIGASFKMRPWEIKTICIKGNAVLLPDEEETPARCISSLPSGWELKNQFVSPSVKAESRKKSGILYFASGYHDGFVRPMERHSKTMQIEIERTGKYDGYSQYWELGGSCWVRMGINEPEYLAQLKTAIKENKLEIIGGTWCEPFSLIVSGESNIRQMFYGTRAIKDNLDYDVEIYGNQEHGTYAQMPQILRSFGIYAVVNRTQWAPYGYESAVDSDVVNWTGPDGTSIAMIPRYHSMDYNNCPWDDRNLQNGSVTGHNRVWRTREQFERMLRDALDHGIKRPLMTMLEDIWAENLRTTDDEIEFYDSLPFVQFISLTKYLEMYGVTK